MDKSIDIEGKLQADIVESTEYTVKTEKENKRLERERRRERRSAKHWQKRSKKAVACNEDLQVKGVASAEETLNAIKLRQVLVERRGGRKIQGSSR